MRLSGRVTTFTTRDVDLGHVMNMPLQISPFARSETSRVLAANCWFAGECRTVTLVDWPPFKMSQRTSSLLNLPGRHPGEIIADIIYMGAPPVASLINCACDSL